MTLRRRLSAFHLRPDRAPRADAPDSGEGRIPSIPDDELGTLVRDAVGEWTMPARRIDASAWHDRVSPRAGRRRFGPFGWAGSSPRSARPLVSGLSLAVVATLIVALSAAIVSGRPGPAASPHSSAAAASPGQHSPSTRRSPSPTVTPPPLEIFGGAPPDQRLLVSDGNGQRLLSIANGSLGPLIEPSSEPGQVFALPDGGFLCACTDTTYQLASGVSPRPSGGLDESMTVTLRVYDAGGRLVRSGALPPYVGAQDPTNEFTQQTVGIRATLAPDGGTLYLGWIERTASGWRSGVDVVDVSAVPRVVQSVPLEPLPLTRAGVQLLTWTGPQVILAPDGRHLVVVRALDLGADSETVDRFSAVVANGRIGSVTKMSGSALPADSCSPIGSQGFAGPSAFFDLCSNASSETLRRVDLSGAPIGDTSLPRVGPMGYFGSLATDPAGTTLYAWGPGAGALTRVDLATGRITGSLTIPQTTASAGRNPLADLLGRLVPSALAKEILQPSLALSPDGSRIYLLGTTSTDPNTPGQSTGVWVVDARRLALVGHWAPPRADLMSVAVSADGSFVVAAGRPGIEPGSTEQASVSVYEASTGRLRLFASQLGEGELMFQQVRQP